MKVKPPDEQWSKIMNRNYRTYTEEFKLEALELLESSGSPGLLSAGQWPSHRVVLVEDALKMALGRRFPLAALLFHSDWGSQFTRHLVCALLDKYDIQVSMNGMGICYDNAPMAFPAPSKPNAPRPSLLPVLRRDRRI